mgnify:CR=1 FL=1
MEETIRIAGIVEESIVDGPGIRMAIFVQGCPHHCPGCHNPETHDLNGGRIINFYDILNILDKNPLISGVTYTGGEPFIHAEKLYKLGLEIKKRNKSIIVYSGYKFEELLELAEKNQDIKNLLNICDILIDGRFEEDKKSLLLKFRGSSNQRIIDLKRSLSENKVVEIEI